MKKKSLSRLVDDGKPRLELEMLHNTMQVNYLYFSDFPFRNFCKLGQHAETNVWEKSNEVRGWGGGN